MDKVLRDLIDHIQFTENVAAKIHGVLDEGQIYRTVTEEFVQSERSLAGILLLVEDGLSLKVAQVSLSSDVVKTLEEAAASPIEEFRTELSESSALAQVIKEGTTLQVTSNDISEAILPESLASQVMGIMEMGGEPSIVTPLSRQGEIIGILMVMAPKLAEHFIPSVRNLAQHISAALDLADERVERKLAEDALQQSEEKFRAIVENAPDQFVIVQRDGIISFVNYVEPGVTLDDIIGASVYDYVVPELADIYRQTQNRVFETGKPERIEVLSIMERTFDCRIAPLEDNDQIEHLMVILTDITDRKLAEEALRQSETRYRQLFDSAPDGVFILDEDGYIVECSNSTMLIYGYSKEEMINKRITEFMHPSSAASLSQGFPQEQPFEGEIRIVRSDGSIVYLWRKGIPLKDADGNLTGVLAYDRDITDRKRAEELLQRHRQRLENVVKERTSSLEEANTALRVMLKTADQIKTEIEETVLFNVKSFALPYLDELKKCSLDDRQKSYIEMLQNSLDQVTEPFLQGVSAQSLTLTPTEVTIMNLIKQGKATKEIASLLNMSIRTVETHRYNIRTKLGLKNKAVNLRTYVSSRE
ncbi:MAG: PAS domain S-box protein [Chloroflexi bacterium]|nr:PAS domain S-box protein [Chloroflexota bacterium]